MKPKTLLILFAAAFLLAACAEGKQTTDETSGQVQAVGEGQVQPETQVVNLEDLQEAPVDITPVDLDQVNRSGPGTGVEETPAAGPAGGSTGGGEEEPTQPVEKPSLSLPCASAGLLFLAALSAYYKRR
jgi:hypothetical protein